MNKKGRLCHFTAARRSLLIVYCPRLKKATAFDSRLYKLYFQVFNYLIVALITCTPAAFVVPQRFAALAGAPFTVPETSRGPSVTAEDVPFHNPTTIPAIVSSPPLITQFTTQPAPVVFLALPLLPISPPIPPIG